MNASIHLDHGWFPIPEQDGPVPGTTLHATWRRDSADGFTLTRLALLNTGDAPVDLFGPEGPCILRLDTPERPLYSFFNFEDARTMCVDLPDDREYDVWNFFEERYEGRARGSFSCAVPAVAARHFAFTPVSDAPRVIGTSFHVTCGAVELSSLESTPHSLSGYLTRPAGDFGKSSSWTNTTASAPSNSPPPKNRFSGNSDQPPPGDQHEHRPTSIHPHRTPRRHRDHRNSGWPSVRERRVPIAQQSWRGSRFGPHEDAAALCVAGDAIDVDLAEAAQAQRDVIT